MRIKTIVILVIIILILTFSSLFLKIIPCKSWIAANNGAIGTFPQNTFCNLSPDSSDGSKTYFYFTTNFTYGILITLLIFTVMVFIIALVLEKIKPKK
jgi:hypothetical protein